MQVHNAKINPNNRIQSPNFTAIKSVKCEGLYKKYPQLANDVVDALKQNPNAMEFCKEYDVDIVIDANKPMFHSDTYSSIKIIYEERCQAELKSWGHGDTFTKSVQESTRELVHDMSPDTEIVFGDYSGDLLGFQIHKIKKNIQFIQHQKALEKEEKEVMLSVKKNFKKDRVNLLAAIKNLINESLD